jgi:hypothetical protein
MLSFAIVMVVWVFGSGWLFFSPGSRWDDRAVGLRVVDVVGGRAFLGGRQFLGKMVEKLLGLAQSLGELGSCRA